MRRPRIKRTTEPIGSPDGDIYLMRPSADSDIRIEKPDEEERQLLESLDGEHTLEQLHEQFGEEAVGDLISQLQELEIVEDAADDDLVPGGGAGAFRPPAPLLQRHRHRGADAVGVPAAAARGEGGGARVGGLGGCGGEVGWPASGSARCG